MRQFQEQVSAGIEFLKFVRCDLDLINIDTLDISDCSRCVFGQFFDHYAWGKARFDFDTKECASLGFTLPSIPKTIFDWYFLNCEWKLQLRELRSTHTTPAPIPIFVPGLIQTTEVMV